jgi:sideroflexin-5
LVFKTNAQIKDMIKLLDKVKAEETEARERTGKPHCLRTPQEITDIRDAQNLIAVSLNSDTGEFIPWFMRMSAFIPVQLPISFGMLMTTPTPFNTILWQWVNQTYNAVMNYGNRNASSKYTNSDIAKSYASAVTIAIALSLGIRRMVRSSVQGQTGATMVMYNTLSTYVACAAAGFSNCYLMRRTELNNGINVLHPDTLQPLGLSKKCAEDAVFKTACSRFLMAAPLFIPAILFYGIEKINMVPANPVLRLTLDMSLVFVNCYLAVPLSVAMFPKFSAIKASELEPEFQNITGKDGKPIASFLYNKGM